MRPDKYKFYLNNNKKPKKEVLFLKYCSPFLEGSFVCKMHVHVAKKVDYARAFSFLLQIQIGVMKMFVFERNCSLISRILFTF